MNKNNYELADKALETALTFDATILIFAYFIHTFYSVILN